MYLRLQSGISNGDPRHIDTRSARAGSQSQAQWICQRAWTSETVLAVY